MLPLSNDFETSELLLLLLGSVQLLYWIIFKNREKFFFPESTTLAYISVFAQTAGMEKDSEMPLTRKFIIADLCK